MSAQPIGKKLYPPSAFADSLGHTAECAISHVLPATETLCQDKTGVNRSKQGYSDDEQGQRFGSCESNRFHMGDTCSGQARSSDPLSKYDTHAGGGAATG